MGFFTYVNHASFKINVDDINLIIDPWLEGSVFDQGWDLLVETPSSFFDFSKITHIWFSHEHPDHFAPWCLKKIDESLRKKITILFQYTKDRRVINFCKSLSFQVIEMQNCKEYSLSKNLNLTCGKMGDAAIDSWLLINVYGTKILNLNDCVVDDFKTANSIYEITGNIDVLCTQFSYANWVGNPEDIERRQQFRREKLLRIKLQNEVFKPSFTMPFASFVYFSHEENKYLNADINTIDEVVEFIKNKTNSKPIVFFPEDNWDFKEVWCNKNALLKYSKAYSDLSTKKFTKPGDLDELQLMNLAKNYSQNIKKNNNKLLLFLYSKFCGELYIKLFYSGSNYKFNLWSGLKEIKTKNKYDVEMSAESLATILKFEWGIGSVQVNGRFRAYNGGEAKLAKVFLLGLLNSTDHYLSLPFMFNFCFRKIMTFFPSKIISVLSKFNIKTELEYDIDYSYYKSWDKYILTKVK